MAPANGDRRHRSVPDWVVPALLALIGILISLGGANVVALLHDNAVQTAGLREDIHAFQIHTENRLTRLEDVTGITKAAKK